MAKGPNRDFVRVELPEDLYSGQYRGCYLLLYCDGTVKLSGYDRDVELVEMLNRGGNTTNGGHVFAKLAVREGIDESRGIQARRDDLVTVRRETWEALMRVRRDA
ncbi:MAG: hypothetical protein CK429_14630 [Mycobacterium sp.]|nr:MAG: hypothetical protein CK429_14630 [Mycobacterium sp.]